MNWAFGRAVGLRFAGALLVLCAISGISIWSATRSGAAAEDQQAVLIIGAVGAVLAVALVLAALAGIGDSMAAQARADAALRTAEARLQRITSSSTAVLYTGTVPEGRFTPTWISENIVRMMGYDREEALHPAWWLDHVHPDDRGRVLGEMPALFSTSHLAMEYRFQHKDGAWRWVRDEARLVRDAAGQPAELFGAWVDITERRRTDESLQQYAAELEAANAELDAFAYSVSHDLRAPLRSIDGFSQALLEDSGPHLDPTGRGHLDRIRGATQRMARLIDDLLELSRVTRAELHREPVDLSALARTVEDELRRTEPARNVAVTIAPGLTAEGDTPLLRVVLENLPGNAWKYTGKRDHAEIAFGADRHNGTTAYYIRDNGAGFDMQYAGKLFGAFQRLHAEADFRGTGIGLATVQRIVHRHGGRVWAEGIVGRGATFYFTL